ncbi:MAG: hypothetical protein V1806_03810 [Pseudomonadota bacterium]
MNSKSFLASKTMWGILIMALGRPALGQMGIDLNDQEAQEIAGWIVTALGGGLAIWGRLSAKKTLALPGASTAALCLLVALGLGLASGCAGAPSWLGGGPDNQVTTTHKDKEGNVTKVEEGQYTDKGLVAQAKRDIAVARAQNPRKSKMTFAPADPAKPMEIKLVNGKLEFEADQPEGAGADGNIADPKSVGERLADKAETLLSILTGGLVTINAQDRQAEVVNQVMKRPSYVQVNPSGQSQVQMDTSGTSSQAPQANPQTTISDDHSGGTP